MRTIPLEHIYAGGDLYERVRANLQRLHGEEYEPEQVFMPDSYDWPGDNEGRTMLALALGAQAAHGEALYLEGIWSRIPERLNSKGYFGKVLPEGVFDEQQLSAHSWFLRSLVELYLWKGEERFLDRIRQVVDHLLLPARGHYRNYPCLPEERTVGGEAIGELAGGMVRNWYLSTDIGCAFIMLDGATHAYTVLPSEPLRQLVEEMIDKYLTIDLIAIKAQTHATLSALRGILRYTETTGSMKYLADVERIYALYRSEGMTENFANYNWFGRPDWTEPCAIVDSFIVAVGLWKMTGRSGYLDDAHAIYYNGLAHAQRHNGGFGCDICAGARSPWLHSHSDLYEASWCCTMRGGEGLARAVEYMYFVEGDTVTIPFYHDNVVRIVRPVGETVVKLSTAYPHTGAVQLEVISSSTDLPLTVRLYIPGWADVESAQLKADGVNQSVQPNDGFVTYSLEPKSKRKLELQFDIGLRWTAMQNRHSIADYTAAWHGPLLLQSVPADNKWSPQMTQTAKGGITAGFGFQALGGGSYRAEDGSGVVLRPVYTHHAEMNRTDAERLKQVIFAKSN